jgi:hypothetical protein
LVAKANPLILLHLDSRAKVAPDTLAATQAADEQTAASGRALFRAERQQVAQSRHRLAAANDRFQARNLTKDHLPRERLFSVNVTLTCLDMV